MEHHNASVDPEVAGIFSDELQLVPMNRPERAAQFYVHPDYPNKLIRWSEEANDGAHNAAYTKKLLAELENRWHIPTCHPDYVVVGSGEYQTVVTVVDRIEDAEPEESVLARAQGNETILSEYEVLSDKLVSYVEDVVENGGLINHEHLYRYQYVYSPSASETNKLILVDVEPLGASYIPPRAERSPEQHLSGLMSSIDQMVIDVVELEKVSGRRAICHDRLQKLIESIDEGEPIEADHYDDCAVRQAKDLLLEVLETGNTERLDSFFDHWIDEVSSQPHNAEQSILLPLHQSPELKAALGRLGYASTAES